LYSAFDSVIDDYRNVVYRMRNLLC